MIAVPPDRSPSSVIRAVEIRTMRPSPHGGFPADYKYRISIDFREGEDPVIFEKLSRDHAQSTAKRLAEDLGVPFEFTNLP